MTSANSSPPAPQTSSIPKASLSFLLLLIGLGGLVTTCIALSLISWLLYALPACLLLAEPVVQAARAPWPGGFVQRCARDPQIFAMAATLAVSGIAGAGAALFLSGPFALEAAKIPVLAGSIISALGFAVLIMLTLSARKMRIPVPAWTSLTGLAPVLFGIFMVTSLPTADEQLDAMFKPHFGLEFEDVRIAYLAYEILPDELFEGTFGMSKSEFLTAWIKVRASNPVLRVLRLPGGEAV